MQGKGFVIAIWAFLPLSSAIAGGGRSLPVGEEHPAVIEKLYTSPVGEVEFTDRGPLGHSGFLRNNRGNLLAFAEVRGGAVCENWLAGPKDSDLPVRCEFVFFEMSSGRFLAVRSEEMEESNLFQAAHGKLRGWRSYVAL